MKLTYDKLLSSFAFNCKLRHYTMVVFAFSKKRCDSMVDSLTSMDMTGGVEKHEIHVFCERCLSRLSPADRKLPQVLRVRELLRRGLARVLHQTAVTFQGFLH